MPVTGKGLKGILVVAEAPGVQEDEQGTQLVGKSGQHLRKILRRLDVDLDRDCWKHNAVCCRPEGNETPNDKQILACRPNVLRAIRELGPRTIILLGTSAVKSVIGSEWKEDVGSIGRWVGWRIPSRTWNAWICPTYHPAYLLRSNDQALDLWFRRHLEAATSLRKVPWPKGAPDYPSDVEPVYEASRASGVLRKMIDRGGSVAFDYETNMLKPDSNQARIVSCAVCWEGKKTIAYPWHGEAVRATGELLKSGRVTKRGWNAKFEERWSRALLGHGVRGWEWDGMIGCHVLDSRSGITSLKFQAYVQLGVGAYDAVMKPFMKSEGSNNRNRMDQADVGQLLLYNGTDARLEWELCTRQMEVISG
jgi:uracil-DNA glycosylase family 4